VQRDQEAHAAAKRKLQQTMTAWERAASELERMQEAS
jgi:hypothetical protein